MAFEHIVTRMSRVRSRREPEMGKVAKAEKLKLRASFYNNLATGFVITGYAVPYFAFMRKVWDDPAFLSLSGFFKILTSGDIWFLTALGLWVIFIAWLL